MRFAEKAFTDKKATRNKENIDSQSSKTGASQLSEWIFINAHEKWKTVTKNHQWCGYKTYKIKIIVFTVCIIGKFFHYEDYPHRPRWTIFSWCSTSRSAYSELMMSIGLYERPRVLFRTPISFSEHGLLCNKAIWPGDCEILSGLSIAFAAATRHAFSLLLNFRCGIAILAIKEKNFGLVFSWGSGSGMSPAI